MLFGLLALLIISANGYAQFISTDAPASTGVQSNASSAARPVNNIPPVPTGPDRYVNDYAHVLSADAKNQLLEELQTLDQRGQAQVVLAIIPATDQELAELAPAWLNKWGIGHKQRDDGLLILLNQDRIGGKHHGNRIFIAVGTGIQGTLPDGRVGRLLDQYAVTAMDQGNAEAAVVPLTQALVEILSKEPIRAAAPSHSLDGLWIALLVLLFFLFNRRRGGFSYLGVPGFGGGFWGGGGSDGGGNGGDWGGFGGGGSDGGGAGR